VLLFAVFLIFFIERLFHVVEQLCKVIHIHVNASKKILCRFIAKCFA